MLIRMQIAKYLTVGFEVLHYFCNILNITDGYICSENMTIDLTMLLSHYFTLSFYSNVDKRLRQN